LTPERSVDHVAVAGEQLRWHVDIERVQSIIFTSHAANRKSRKESVESTKTCRASSKLGQAITFDQLAISGPLLLELSQGRCVHHCTARSELMDMNVYQLHRPLLQH
jgi:hypothetical protein